VALTVLVNAGPWLPVPPQGYGGIENVLATLIPELRSRGVRVVLCGVEGCELEVDRFVPTLPEPKFRDLAKPYGASMGIAHAHMLKVLAELRENPVDIVHDHLEVVGVSMLAAAKDVAPVLHTLHWDLAKHPDFYGSFDGAGRVFMNALSPLQAEQAPANLRRQIVATVPLAVPVERFPFRAEKDGPFVMVARINRAKGTDVAARVCRGLGEPLTMAGPVGGHSERSSLEADTASNAEADFYREEVKPLEGEGVTWVGSIGGRELTDLMSGARAALFPGRWHEPGGTAVIEALACGTPVIAMSRGAMPSLIDHGVTGWLAEDGEEFASYLPRAGEIDPAACRRAAEERFDAPVMAERYLELYESIANTT